MKSLSRLLAGAVAAAAISASVAVASANNLVVGGKAFTEQLIIAELTKQLLEANGYTVDKRDGMGTSIVRAALENGEVDLYWEYTGTSLITFNQITERLSPEETYERVKELDGEKGLVWLAPSQANNTYAITVRPDNPKTDDLETVSDLAAAYNEGEEIILGTTAEFPRRQDGLLGLQETYGFEAGRANIRPMDLGLAYRALGNGDLDVISSQATDGLIAAMNLRILEDDKDFFPNYALTPVVRAEVLEANPNLQEILESLSTRLDDPTMQRLNGEVDVDRKTVEQVATDYLTAEDLN